MNPLTRLYRRWRAFRVLCCVLMVPAGLLLFFTSDDMFARYTQTGNVILLFLWLFFAAWTWWHGEDRDRRQRLGGTESSNGDHGSASG